LKNLLNAIKNKYNDGDTAFRDLRAVNTGGLYTEQHLQGQDLPYTVLHHVGTSMDYTMGRTRIEDATIQFSIYAAALSTALDIHMRLTEAFDDCELEYMDEHHLIMQRVAGTGPTKDLDCWQITTDYQCLSDVNY